jgi:hypothetical protein
MGCRAPRSRSVTVGLVSLLLAGACAGGGGKTYHDPAGWTIEVPHGWRVVPFSLSNARVAAAGAQVSNMQLARPSIMPGVPIQANGLVLPADGIALIVTTDTDPRASQPANASPPLSLDQFTKGSAPPGAPTLDILWFAGNGRTFLATVKTGAEASATDLRLVADLVRSLRFDSAGM